jgi:F-type H+-transporting ATPase subunit epsilon
MADGLFHLEIITPDSVLVSEEIDSLEVPGTHGEFQIMAEHTPFLTALSIGALSFTKSGTKTNLSISGGFCEVMPDKTIILAQAAEREDQIDKDRAMAAHKRAEERLQSRTPEIDASRAEMSLKRAINRINVADMK